MPLDAGHQNGRKVITGANGQPADPHADDFITNDDFALIPEGLRDKVRIRLAALSRENERTGKMLERMSAQPQAAQNGNGHEAEPAKKAVDPQNILTWDDADIEAAVNDFDAYDARLAADGNDEEAKKVVLNPRVRKQINAARVELGRRAGANAAREEIAPFKARSEAEQTAQSVFGQIMQSLSPKYGGAQNVSRLIQETKDDVDERLAMVGKSRQTATPHEIGMAMASAVEARASSENRDGDGGMYRRGRPEIAGEGFGGRARAGAPDADADISAHLQQGRAPEANRLMIQRFLYDPGYQPPREFVPQQKADF